MAKKNSKFNGFASTPFAQEINEQMADAQQQPFQPAAPAQQPAQPSPTPERKKSARTSGETWTLVQGRVPKDMYQRMALYCMMNEVKKGDFLVEAVAHYLNELGV